MSRRKKLIAILGITAGLATPVATAIASAAPASAAVVASGITTVPATHYWCLASLVKVLQCVKVHAGVLAVQFERRTVVGAGGISHCEGASMTATNARRPPAATTIPEGTLIAR